MESHVVGWYRDDVAVLVVVGCGGGVVAVQLPVVEVP